MSSTISSQNWQEDFTAEFYDNASKVELYEMRFLVNGVEKSIGIEAEEIIGKNAKFSLSYAKMISLRFDPAVGQVVSPYRILMTKQTPGGDIDFVEIWHA